MPIEDIAIGPRGDVYLAEGGGRIVHVGNARTGERYAQVLYAARERLNGLAVSPDGSLHAVGLHYHTNAGGAWRKESVLRKEPHAELVSVWASSEHDVFVGGSRSHSNCEKGRPSSIFEGHRPMTCILSVVRSCISTARMATK